MFHFIEKLIKKKELTIEFLSESPSDDLSQILNGFPELLNDKMRMRIYQTMIKHLHLESLSITLHEKSNEFSVSFYEKQPNGSFLEAIHLFTQPLIHKTDYIAALRYELAKIDVAKKFIDFAGIDVLDQVLTEKNTPAALGFHTLYEFYAALASYEIMEAPEKNLCFYEQFDNYQNQEIDEYQLMYTVAKHTAYQLAYNLPFVPDQRLTSEQRHILSDLMEEIMLVYKCWPLSLEELETLGHKIRAICKTIFCCNLTG